MIKLLLCPPALLLGIAVLCPFTSGGSAGSLNVSYFSPSNRLSGVGAGRSEISEELLARRTDLMIESQTFGIMRDSRAVAGAARISSPALQKLFAQAANESGLPASLISAVAYLESWGEAKAVSPAGPKGIMQISAATAKRIGLRIVHARRYRMVNRRKRVRLKNKKYVYRTYRRRVPYSVVVRDDRLVPSRAIPAAAKYLAGMERKYGSRDWAIFAYHCGEGCAAEFQSLAQEAEGMGED
ncbi:MAG: transglycosylase SLT domain-containing protein, partial [Bryobacteraceae bacterium]